MEVEVNSFSKGWETSLKREQEKESEEAACSAAEQSEELGEEQIEIINETETTQPLFLSELQVMQKDFFQQGKRILSWLLWCWDIGASSQELEGKEAWQLGSFAKGKVIDKGIGKTVEVLGLWLWLL